MNADHRDSNASELSEARLTAYALSQLHETERAAVEAQLAGLDEATGRRVRRTVEQIRALAGHVREGSRHDPGPEPSPGLRAAVERRLGELADSPAAAVGDLQSTLRRQRARRRWIALAVAACILIAAAPLYLLVHVSVDPRTEREVALGERQQESIEAGGSTVSVTSEESDDSSGSGIEGPRSETAEGVRNEMQELRDQAREDAHKIRGEAEARAADIRNEAVRVAPEAFQAGREQELAQGGAAASGQSEGGTGLYGMGNTMGMPGLAGQPVGTAPGAGMPGMGPGSGSSSFSTRGPSYGGYAGTAGAGYGMDGGAGMMPGAEDDMYGSGVPGPPKRYSAGNQSTEHGYSPGFARVSDGQSNTAQVADGPGDGSVHFLDGNANGAGMMGGMEGGMYGYGQKTDYGTYYAQVASDSEQGQVHELDVQLARAREGLRQLTREAGGGSPYSPGTTEESPGYRALAEQIARLKRRREELARELRERTRRRAYVLGTEQYDRIVENEFLSAASRPLSTFSIDVDTASYANVRRFLNEGRWPPPGAVRIEEMVNYFRYDYAPPDDGAPFSVHMEVAQCPWQGEHRLLRIGLKGREVEREKRGPSSLVFLLDVSGSMRDRNKLPLLRQAMRLLVEQLTEDDRVAIVTYARDAGLKLESTCAADRRTILDAIDSLSAGGSTHGSAGIQLAYEQAGQHFVEGGTNRVILATDGDLNVGITDDDELVKLIRKKARSGVFLTVLGFGTGNLKDAKLEKLADHGNGMYAYVDNLREARKVLIEQVTGSLVTIAKDVKIQVEFNPAEVERYRLTGYENRLLAARDFDNDKKDAGEIGAGHTVTALYEIVPAGRRHGESGAGDDEGDQPGDDGPMLKYQRPAPKPVGELTEAASSGELLTLRLRYKEPDGKRSKLLEFVAKDSGQRFGYASPDFQFAAAVASFGMVLRGSQYAGDATLPAVEEFAVSGLGSDPGGYRAEFVDLVRRAQQLSPRER